MFRFRHLRDNERGMTLVFVATGFMAFLSATTLAIDVGMFMTARSQAQNAADAGALAGAVSFVRNSYADRSPGGPAVLVTSSGFTRSRLLSARGTSIG